MSMTTATGVHILVYPYPTSGHIIPLLDLTQRLLSRGLTVTVLVTPDNLPLLEPYLSTHPSSLKQLVLPAPDPAISCPPQKRLVYNIRAFRDLHYPMLLQWFQSQSSPPLAIVSDILLAWTRHLASELGVPRIVFCPCSAFALSVGFSMGSDPQEPDDPEDMNFQVSFPKIPESPVYPWWQIPPHLRCFRGDPDKEFFMSNLLDNAANWGLLFNSFVELERVYFDFFKRELGHDRVFAVGPVLPPDNSNLEESASRGGVSSVPCHEVMTWLDARPDHSVVYVFFGSLVVLTSRQMDVLTSALESSGVQFLLCVRGPDEKRAIDDDDGVIPDGYEARVEGRGFVIKGWAPQVAVLRHRAVGAFLTHCGWNSTLEGIAAGVVMLTWPMGADQYTNAKLLVDQLGVAIRAGEGTQNIPESTELAQLFAISVEGSRPERSRAKELSDVALSAVNGGSSAKELDEFVKLLADVKK